ncbi:hypothetical protein N7532_007871 [Penicillium argentinense]|uniref:Pentatricopeptide repeat protein n=1 Tax=Penicillium argentinense TaxID=1131581 RepID=A0A9W9EWA2_9EURO|nr:uncharacterized protein N7532_007871 [Penicillium argentinense]KAJ5089187.1 hypothetical protein N7532_007871 [Penicillium argentinense]
MFAKAANSTPAVPSRNALRVLRQLALAGSTVGGFCTVGVLTYDVHRRVRVAEQIIENKRTLRTSAPNYDATASAKRLALMMEAAEAGEFMGLDSLKKMPRLPQVDGTDQRDTQGILEPHPDSFQPCHGLEKPKQSHHYDSFDLSRSVEAKKRAINRVALARKAGQAKEGEEKVAMSLEERIRTLIADDKEIEAVNIFLKRVPARVEEPISYETREAARQLFAANCLKGNIFLARTLFERLEKVSVIDTEMWATMMHILAKEGHVDSAGSIFERHRASLSVPSHLLEVVLRCLMESRRLGPAKALFYTRIRNDENGGLCGAFLDGIWRKTRNIELVNVEFRTILSKLANLQRTPTEKVFNPLVKAYIEAGQFEDAEALVADMPVKFDVQPGCRTLGLLVYARALKCDWEGVFSGLREMHQLGFTRDKRSFALIFDRVFLEYYPTHAGRQIFDFLVTCIDEFEIVPDKVLHRHILEALCERGDTNYIGQITRMAEDRNWNTGLDQDTLIGILGARRVSMEGAPVGIWRMLQAAKEQYGQASSSQRLLGSGYASYSLDRGVLRPIHVPAEETFPKTMKDLVSSNSISSSVPLHKQMENHINGARFDEALGVFRGARRAGFVIRPLHVHLAVIATILGNGPAGLHDAQILIKREWPLWSERPKYRHNPQKPRVLPLFFQQIMQIHDKVTTGNLLKMALFEYYNLCRTTPTLTVKHHALTSLCKRLISDGRRILAIVLLTAVYRSKWRKTHGFDQVMFKLCLRAFTHAENLRGVWWCLLAVLSRSEPVRRDFLVEAQRLKHVMETKFGPKKVDSPDASYNLTTLYNIISALEEKSMGDEYWTNRSPDPVLKKSMRSRLVSLAPEERHTLPAYSVEKMVDHFDEEMELDFLTGYKKRNEGELEQVWSELAMLTDQSLLPEQARWYPGGKPVR